jgi:tetratricopeptide (TPR) repeat protein
MKNYLLFALSFILLSGYVSGQDAKKLLKNASKNLGKYNLDPVANKDLLLASVDLVNQAFTIEAAKSDPEAWNMKGQIYNEIAKAEMNRKVVEPEYKLATPDAGIVAQESFKKGLDLATKKSHTKDALTGLREGEDFINNIAITFFQEQDYKSAFLNFAATLHTHQILIANATASRLDDAFLKADQIFYTGVCAYFSDDREKSVPYFEELYKAGDTQPLVYEALFTINTEKDEAKAMTYLDAGRKAHPDDSGLLFAEINYYLRTGKLDQLVEKLKAAIEKEPDNVSVYTTLGNVYDQLNQKERTEKNVEKADEYFELAYSYFKQALEKEPNNFDAVYSQGALYYNKAASMTALLNEVANDYTSAGTKKYNAIKAEMDGYFEQALPYFLKAEELNPKDINTMIACREIYARMGDLDKSAAYKEKIEMASIK